jgi:hypothetical protein
VSLTLGQHPGGWNGSERDASHFTQIGHVSLFPCNVEKEGEEEDREEEEEDQEEKEEQEEEEEEEESSSSTTKTAIIPVFDPPDPSGRDRALAVSCSPVLEREEEEEEQRGEMALIARGDVGLDTERCLISSSE